MEQPQNPSAKKITVLYPFPCAQTSKKTDKKQRVAAYCRVSTATYEQLISYHSQIRYYQQYILSRPEYEMAGIFADAGVSGTGIRKRDAFIKMMEAAKEGKIDLIITKSLSRFGRNTLDCLKNIRALKELGVDVYFEKENIHTLHSEGEMLLTLIAAVAQNESLNLSENVKWGIRRQYERGNVSSIPSGKFLGYKKDKQGHLIIDEAQAAIVQRIYQLFLNGMGTYQIAGLLTDEQVSMAYGGKEWSASHIYRVLTNEKYQGDTRFQKTFNADHLTKRRVDNKGQLPQYFLEDTHPAIIERETWALVQLEMARQKAFIRTHSMNKFHHHCEQVPLSGKIVCGECGRTFNLRTTRRLVSDNIRFWQCRATLSAEKNCRNALKLNEEAAQQAFISAWNELVLSPPQVQADDKLTRYRQTKLLELLGEHGPIDTMPYDLMLKALDHKAVHAGFLRVIFLAGYAVRVNLPGPPVPHPRWTHTSKSKSPMALRRMDLGYTQAQLAQIAQISRKHLNRVENGLCVPTPELAQRLAEILGLN